MKPEDIMNALGSADSAYLTQAMEEPAVRTRRVSPLGRMALIAAAVLLLAGSVFAAVTVLAPKKTVPAPAIAETEAAPGWYELYFENNPAAENAPDAIADYYLPTAIPAEYSLAWSQLNNPTGKVLSASAGWEVDPLPNGGAGSPDSVELGDGSVFTPYKMAEYTVKPLKVLNGADPFAYVQAGGTSAFVVEDMSKVEKSGVVLNGVEYVVYDVSKEAASFLMMDETWYFWTDDANRYLFSFRFSAPVPQAEREAILTSVAPVDEQTWNKFYHLGEEDPVTLLNRRINAWNEEHPTEEPLPLYRVYMPALRPEGYTELQYGFGAIPNGGLKLETMDTWIEKSISGKLGLSVNELLIVGYSFELQDREGHTLRFEKCEVVSDSAPIEHKMERVAEMCAGEGQQVDTFTLDGVEILRAVYIYPSPYGVRPGYTDTQHYEDWYFAAPDGTTVLQLHFSDQGNEEPVPEELKIAIFRSIEEVDPSTLPQGYHMEGGDD